MTYLLLVHGIGILTEHDFLVLQGSVETLFRRDGYNYVVTHILGDMKPFIMKMKIGRYSIELSEK